MSENKKSQIISALNLKQGYGKSKPIDRPLSVSEFEDNFVTLADGINSVNSDLTDRTDRLHTSVLNIGSPIKMIGKGSGIDLSVSDQQNISFDAEGIYAITDILITNVSAVVTAASGGTFLAMDPFSYGGDKSLVALSAAKAGDDSIIIATTGQGLQALTTGASFINTLVGGSVASSGFTSNTKKHLAAGVAEEDVQMSLHAPGLVQVNSLSSSSSNGGITLVNNTLVANELYFTLDSVEETSITCDVYVFGYKIAEVGGLNDISSNTTTTTTGQAYYSTLFSNTDSEVLDQIQKSSVEYGKKFGLDFGTFTSNPYLYHTGEIGVGKTLYLQAKNGEYYELSLINGSSFTFIDEGGVYFDVIEGQVTDIYESPSTTTTTTANSAVTISFLNQDANGPITWEDIEINPIIEFYSVTLNSAENAVKDGKESAAKESKSRFTLSLLNSGIFDGEGTYQFNVSYSSENDSDGKGVNLFAYKVYNRSTVSYEKTDLIWYGLFSLSSDGTIYETDGNGESVYDGVIARPIPTSATVSAHLIGYGDADLENVTIYYTKPYSEIDSIFGIEKSRSVFGVTDASGIVSATVSFVSDRIILISDEFNDSSSSITYVSNETTALLSTLGDGVVQVDFYLDPKPIEFDITSYYGTGIQVNRVILGDDGTIDWNLSTQLSDFGVFDKSTDSWNADNATFVINPNQPGNYRVLIFEMVQSGEEMSQNVVYEDVIYANFGDVHEVNVTGNIGNVSYTLSDYHITPYVDATYTLQSMYYSHDSGSTVAGPYFDVNVESGLVTSVVLSKVPYQLNLLSHVGQEFRIFGFSFGEGYNANDDIIINVNTIGTAATLPNDSQPGGGYGDQPVG